MQSEKITSVCIPTCNRPESITTCLTSLIGNLKKYSRRPRILIVDDSENPASAQKTKEIAAHFQKEYGGIIECMDRSDRKIFAESVSQKTGVPEEVVSFALLGDKKAGNTVGSAENTFFLKTKGEKILIMDDDVICDFAEPTQKDNPFFTTEPPGDYWFLNDGAHPPPHLQKTNLDLLNIHETVLGMKPKDILGKEAPDFLDDGKIFDSYMGFFGDSPMESHTLLLIRPQVMEQIRVTSEIDYENMKAASCLAQVPQALALYNGPMCISMVMGVDNRDDTLPFLPVGRSSDSVFGMLRNKVFADKFSCHVPKLISHQRPSGEKRVISYNIVFDSTKMNRVIASLAGEINIAEINTEENLKIIGRRFIDIARLTEDKLSIFLESHCRKITKFIGMHLDNILENNPDMPEFWIKDIKSKKEALKMARSE